MGLVALACSTTSHAQTANLTFSGGLGTPLVLTLTGTVNYTVTTAATSGPFFIFRGVGNAVVTQPGSGTIAFSIGGATSTNITYENSNVTTGSVTATDFYLFASNSDNNTFAVGNTVTLTGGTFTTSANFAGAPPAGGNFPTFITDGNATPITAVPAPEPGTWAMLGLGGVVLVGANRLRRRRTMGAVAA